ncbi:hypothetical protein [Microbispora sp. H13382]|uniref:hypothetical protein n=1 Tax=Microbispora sp. H13382 TaxID=2729112 RepID=UPI001600FBAB|nr:hypothetical protein [Microbispora sp. H13382]
MATKGSRKSFRMSDDEGMTCMNKTRKAVMVMAALFSVGAASLISAGPAAAMAPTPRAAEDLYNGMYPYDICDLDRNASGCREY